MNRLALAVAVLAAVTLTGCSAAEDPATPSKPTPTPTAVQEPPAAATIQDVWEKIGCAENDAAGSRGMIDALNAPSPPVVHEGACSPYPEGERAYFFELPSEDEARSWFASGELQVGAADTPFIDGAVVILATDPVTADLFDDVFTRLDG